MSVSQACNSLYNDFKSFTLTTSFVSVGTGVVSQKMALGTGTWLIGTSGYFASGNSQPFYISINGAQSCVGMNPGGVVKINISSTVSIGFMLAGTAYYISCYAIKLNS